MLEPFDRLGLTGSSTNEDIHEALRRSFEVQTFAIRCQGCGRELNFLRSTKPNRFISSNNCPDCAQKEFTEEKRQWWRFGF